MDPVKRTVTAYRDSVGAPHLMRSASVSLSANSRIRNGAQLNSSGHRSQRSDDSRTRRVSLPAGTEKALVACEFLGIVLIATSRPSFVSVASAFSTHRHAM